jgi:hypothetical protein
MEIPLGITPYKVYHIHMSGKDFVKLLKEAELE